MFYKPKYCCNCGEKIERDQWSLTTNRRFCDICKDDFIVQRAVSVIFIGLMAVIGVFGVGSYWRSGEKPLNVSGKQFAAVPSGPGKNQANQSSPANSNSGIQPPAPAGNVLTNQPNAARAPNLTTKQPPKESESVPAAAATVYFCGALTKKGTPCSRRVKGGGRCWQHQGQPAVLPPEKLIAGQ